MATAPCSLASPVAAGGPDNDAVVAQVGALLRSRPTAALSLDCFDTLLWRSVPKPTDVFFLVGERLCDLGLVGAGVSPRSFMKLRIVAEQTARRSAWTERKSSEVGLTEIYGLPGWRHHTSLSAIELARHELQVDADVTTADPLLRAALVEDYQRRPDRTRLLVSDTWYGADAIRHLLMEADLGWLCEAPVFTSSEHGVDKRGGLLDVALKALHLDPEDCLHVGDKLDVDVRPARGLGATAIHLPATTGLAERALVAEGRTAVATEPSPLLDPHAGDSGLSALRGRLGRRRPAAVGPDDAVYWELGSTILGPVLTGFAEWVHERTAELGITTALCLLREGELLAGLVNGVPGTGPRCTALPFWASRAAFLRASFFTGSRSELARLLWSGDAPRPTEILATLGLQPEEVPGCEQVMTALAGDHAPADAATAFLDFLAAREDARRAIVQRSGARRRAFVDYLRSSLDGAGTTRVALVDLGFGATIQALLGDILAAEGIHLEMHGLYLFTNHQSLVRQLGGNLVEGFLADGGSSQAELAVLERSPQILEVLTTSAHGSLLEISADGHPVLAPRAADPVQEHQRRVVHDGIGAFQHAWNAFVAERTVGTARRLGQSPERLREILVTFVADPGVDVAVALSRWDYERNCESTVSDPLVPRALERCAPYLAPEHLALAKPTDLHWVGGAAAYGGMADQVRWLQEGLGRPGTFLAGADGGRLLLTVRSAHRQDGGQSAPLLANDKGTGVLSWHGRADADRLVLGTSGDTAVLRLDQVRLERADGATEYFDWRGRQRTTPFGLQVVADEPIADGVALVSGALAVELVVTTGATSPITRVEVLYRAMAA